jgi:hypothetical protein
MSGMLWAKMPSKWISAGELNEKFSSNKLSTDISALKIYICLCLFSQEIQRKKIHNMLTIHESTILQFEACVTYDQLTESASLSRLMVSKGLNKLVECNLIKREGTRRKIIYIIVGTPGRGWCKLPKHELIKKDFQISAFCGFTQRYKHERDALKIFIYLLSIRSNSKRYVDVSRGVISIKTGVEFSNLDGALGFLRSVGLLKNIKSKGYLARSKNKNLEADKLHRYWVVGCQSLNLSRVYAKSEDYEGD